MAQLYSTGPAHLFIQYPGLNQLMYLGTCKKAPKIIGRPGWQPVHNDIGGPVIPFDVSFQGEEAFTFTELTRWNETVYARLAARPHRGQARGNNLPGDVGSLMQTEGLNLGLYVYFPYVAKPAYLAGGMPAGYRFPFTTVEGPDEFSELGTTPRELTLVFHHLRQYFPKTGQLLLYDHTVGQMPAID
jgi:hypothetical protein